jgi:hypothetical protein
MPNLVFNLAINSLARGAALTVAGAPGQVKDMCWSLLPGIHPDRALLVSGLTHALKIVEKIEPQAA